MLRPLPFVSRWACTYRLTLLALFLAGQSGTALCEQGSGAGLAPVPRWSAALDSTFVPGLGAYVPLFGIVVIALLAGVWLQRRVARGQTAVMGEWLRREASLVKQYRELFENAQDAMLIYEPEGETILNVNGTACDLYGWSPSELIGAQLKVLSRGASSGGRPTSSLKEQEPHHEVSVVHYRKDGRPISIVVRSSPIEYAGRAAVLSIHRDVSECVAAAEAFRRRGTILDAVCFAAERLLSGSDWETSIQRVLEHLGRSMQVSRAYVFENHRGPQGDWLSSHRYEWSAPGIAPQIDNAALRDLSWESSQLNPWMEEMSQGRVIQGRPDKLPEVARRLLEDQGIQSLVTVPIFVGEAWWGFIGFDDCLALREWSTVEMEALRVAAKILGAALQRKQADETLLKANELVRFIVQAAPVAIISLDHQDLVRMWNPAAERLFGWTEKEVLGGPLPVVSPEDSENYKSFFARMMQGEAVADLERRRQRKDGTWVDVQLSTASIFDAHGGVVGYFGMLYDITERKRTEQALMESEGRYRRLLGTLTDYIYSVELAAGMVVRKSHGQGCIAVTGYTPEEFQQDPELWSRMMYDEDRSAAVAQSERLLAGMNCPAIEHRIRRKDGSIRWVRNTPVLRYDADHHLIAYDGLVSDITERKMAQHATEERTAYLNALIKHSPIAIAAMNSDGRLTMCNPAFESLFLYRETDIRGQNVDELIAPGGLDDDPKEITRRVGQSETVHVTTRRRRRDGTIADVELYAVPLHLGGKLVGSYGIYNDITTRNRAEAENLRLVTAIEQAAEGIVITDVQGSIQYVNPAFSKMTGYDRGEAVGRNPRLLKSGQHTQKFYQDLWETILEGGIWHGEVINQRKDGTHYPEEMTIAPVRDSTGVTINFIAIKQDVTARKRAEEDMKRYASDLETSRGTQEKNTLELTKAFEELGIAKARAEAASRARAFLI